MIGGCCGKCGDSLPDGAVLCGRCKKGRWLRIWGLGLLVVAMIVPVAAGVSDASVGVSIFTDVAGFVMLLWGTGYWLGARRQLRENKPEVGAPLKYCLDCGAVGPEKQYTPGSFGMMVLLTLLAVLPGLIYWAWRLTCAYQGCGKCASKRIIPADSPAAQPALRQGLATSSHAEPAEKFRFCTACGGSVAPQSRFCGSCGKPA